MAALDLRCICRPPGESSMSIDLIVLFILLLLFFFFVAAYGRRLRRKDEERREQALLKTCPRCAEQIKAAALVCRYCGHEFAEPVVTGVSGSDKK